MLSAGIWQVCVIRLATVKSLIGAREKGAIAMIDLAAGVLVMVIEFAVIPEQRNAFVEISTAQVETVRAREGNRGFDVLIDPKQPNVVAYIERWDTADQQEAFFAWWNAQGLSDRLRPLVTAAPRISTFETAE